MTRIISSAHTHLILYIGKLYALINNHEQPEHTCERIFTFIKYYVRCLPNAHGNEEKEKERERERKRETVIEYYANFHH